MKQNKDENILERAHETYQERSETASTLCRQLCFAGIALIWVFKVEAGDTKTIHAELALPAMLIVLALMLDLVQYTSASFIYSRWRRKWEKKHHDGEALPSHWPASLNYPALACFWGKIPLTVIAYVIIFVFLAKEVLA